MKFGKEFKKQQVPEWLDAYMDYGGFKKLLKRMHNLKPRNPNRVPFYRTFSGLAFQSRHVQGTVDIEEQARTSAITQEQDPLQFIPERESYESNFFRKLKDELQKVNAFYRDKVEEVKKEADLLTKQMNALVALRIKVRRPDLIGGCNSLNPDSENVPDTVSYTVLSPGFNRSERSNRRGSDVLDIDINDLSFIHAEPEENLEEPTSSVSEIASAQILDAVADDRAQLEVLDHVKLRTSENLVSPIRCLLKDPRDKELCFKKEELKDVEKRLKNAFVEFYHKLRLLQYYSFVNLLGFSKTLKKYDKIESRNVSQSYMKLVDDSYLGSCDEVIKLLEKVEASYIKHFSNANRKEGMKLLRPKPKKEKHSVTFFSGFLSGCCIALLVALVLLIETNKLLNRDEAAAYMHEIFPLYSLYGFIILHLLLYASNIYLWRRCRINYHFIFGFKNGTELSYREVSLISTGLAVFVIATFLVHIHIKMDFTTHGFDKFIDMVPLGLIIVILFMILLPFNIIYRSSRFFLVQCLFRCICAPFYKVTLPDFFMADQLTSQIQAIRCIEYYVCYYGWERASNEQTMCESLGVYKFFYYVEAIIPFWLRFLQCMRRLWEDRDMVHGYNGLRYFLTIAAILIRTTYNVQGGTLWLSSAISSSVIATLANTYWDIVEDWGLLQRKSTNKFLRDKLMLKRKSIYFIAMVLNVLLRFAWLQLVSDFDMRSLSGIVLSSTLSCLEILRRGLWNFFRIENEHLYNVGRYRAFKSVPLPFVYNDDDDDDDRED